MKIEDIAKICHQANAAYCEANGDFSQAQWELTPAHIKASAIQGVQTYADNPGITPEEMHESWMKFKQGQGWTYGEVKNEDMLTHPCMLPYDELSEIEKVKDTIFSSICAIFFPVEDEPEIKFPNKDKKDDIKNK